jgi:hypothetical protein
MKEDTPVHNFCLVIPVSGKPKITSCDYGSTQYDSGAATVRCSSAAPHLCIIPPQLAWLVDSIDAANQSGSLELSTPPADCDSFFPIEVHFR